MSELAAPTFDKKEAWSVIKRDLNLSVHDGKVTASADLGKVLKVVAKLTKNQVDDSLVNIVVGFLKEFEFTTKKTSE